MELSQQVLNVVVVVEYSYDSWGNVISITGSLASTLGQDNPFRYRGYYYDSDTGLYYLNSRYYDSNTGRFINADGLLGANQDILAYNLFAYCSNNPINCFDASGNGKKWNWLKENVIEPAKKKIGIAVNYGYEKTTDFFYGIFLSLEEGYGYNKSFDTGKPINIFSSINMNIGKNFSASIGIDVNYSGYGASIQIGTESAISIHLKDNHIEFGANIIGGRSYIKHSYVNDSAIEVYDKLYINNIEIAVAVVVAIYIPEAIPALATVGTALVEQGA